MSPPQIRYRLKRRLALASALVLLLLFAAYGVVSFQIGSSVQSIAADAMQAHAGDRVEALMAFVEDSTHSLKERNRAVWALGQLGDARALRVLERLHTGEPCDHANSLCRRELDKAIRLARGGVNLSAAVWRRDSL